MTAILKVERAKGTVKFFNTEKGFGFAKREGQQDVFIHANALKRSGIFDGLDADDEVEFDIEPVPGKGPKGSNFKVLKRAKRTANP